MNAEDIKKKSFWYYFKIVIFVLVLFSFSFKLYNWYRGGEFSLISKPILPKCESKEVAKLVSDRVNDYAKSLNVNVAFIELKNTKEIGFNPDKEIRSCSSLLIHTQGSDVYNFLLNWKNKKDKVININSQLFYIPEQYVGKNQEAIREDINNRLKKLDDKNIDKTIGIPKSGLDIELLNLKNDHFCHFYIGITNNTTYNITSIIMTGLMKDRNGLVIGKIGSIDPINRIKYGEKITTEFIALQSCNELSELAKIEMVLELVGIDGKDYIQGLEEVIQGIRKSRVQNIDISLR